MKGAGVAEPGQSSWRGFMRGTQDPVPKGYMGSNPIPCTKLIGVLVSVFFSFCILDEMISTHRIYSGCSSSRFSAPLSTPQSLFSFS